MSISVKRKRNNRFKDLWFYIALGSTGLVVLAFFFAGIFEKRLVNGRFSVSPGNYASVKTFDLEPQKIGALRVDANADIPNNTNIAYEIQLVDSQNKVLASAVKEAWKESGIWYEGGESGSWSESNLKGGIDIRTKKKEKVTLRIGVLEYADKFGQELTSSKASFVIDVRNGVVDTRSLWFGVFTTLFMSGLTKYSLRNS